MYVCEYLYVAVDGAGTGRRTRFFIEAEPMVTGMCRGAIRLSETRTGPRPAICTLTVTKDTKCQQQKGVTEYIS